MLASFPWPPLKASSIALVLSVTSIALLPVRFAIAYLLIWLAMLVYFGGCVLTVRKERRHRGR